MNIYVCYALIAFIALMAAVKVAFQNDFVRKFSNNLADTSLYLSFAFFFIAAVMLFTVNYAALPSRQTIAMGVGFGLLTTIGQITYSYAMKNGPVSLTVLIVCFSLIIPTGTGIIFWGEKPSVFQCIGLAVIAIAMVLILYKKEDKKPENADLAEQKSENKATKYFLWLAFLITAFVAMGASNIIQVWHQKIPAIKSELNWFVMICYLTAGISSLLIIPCSRQKISFKFNKRVWIDVVCGAIALGLHNYIRPILSNYVDNTILHPMTNILNIGFITLMGVLLFKDKIRVVQWIGLGLGCVAIVLLCL